MFPLESRILVLEDMAGMRQMIKGILKQLGFKNILAAENGQIGYDLLCQGLEKNEKIDLVLSDWKMPALTGIELLKLVRLHPELGNTPFLLITAERDFTQVRDALALNVNGYIVKPFNADTIKSKLELVWKQLKTAQAAAASKGKPPAPKT